MKIYNTIIAAAVAIMAIGSGSAKASTIVSSGSNNGALVTIGTTQSTLTETVSSTLNGTYGRLATTTNSGVLGPASDGTQLAYAALPRGGTFQPPHLPAPLSGSEWVSPYLLASGVDKDMPLASIGSSPSFSVPPGYYKLTETFNLAPGATQFSIVGKMLSSENVYGVFLDGNAISYSNGNPTYSTPGTFSGGGGTYGNGTATLAFIVKNVNAGYIALDFSGTVAPEPMTILAYLIAILGIAGLAFKSRNRTAMLVA